MTDVWLLFHHAVSPFAFVCRKSSLSCRTSVKNGSEKLSANRWVQIRVANNYHTFHQDETESIDDYPDVLQICVRCGCANGNSAVVIYNKGEITRCRRNEYAAGHKQTAYIDILFRRTWRRQGDQGAALVATTIFRPAILVSIMNFRVVLRVTSVSFTTQLSLLAVAWH